MHHLQHLQDVEFACEEVKAAINSTGIDLMGVQQCITSRILKMWKAQVRS